MTFGTYLWTIRLEAILTFLVFVMVVLAVDPDAGILGKVLFYGSLFLWVSGVYTLFLAWMRRLRRHRNAPMSLGTSLRQGALLGLFTIIILAMQALGVLVWWDGLLVLALFLFVELFFLLREEGKI